jgi:hypothetical protein
MEDWEWGQTVNKRWLRLVNSTLVAQRGLQVGPDELEVQLARLIMGPGFADHQVGLHY